MTKLDLREASERSLETNIAVRDKSRINRGIAMPCKEKSCFRQSRGVEVHHPNLIREYSLSLIIALTANL